MTISRIFHDSEGYIVAIRQLSVNERVPVGVPYIDYEIPQGKQIKITDGIGVDVSVTPHQVMLEDIPPSEIDVLRNEMEQRTAAEAEAMRLETARNNAELFETVIMLTGGGM